MKVQVKRRNMSAPEMSDVILELRGISKKFGGVQALDDVTMTVRDGSIHGIIGPNGAGKTTLFNVITGLVRPDSGELLFQGRVLGRLKPHSLVPIGISRTFQNIRLFREMTVLDNVMVAQHTHSPTPILSILLGTSKARKCEEVNRQVALRSLERVGLLSRIDEQARNLPYGQQKLVEFARALAAEPKVILLDEPAAGMNPAEKENLLRIIAGLRSDGLTVILIEHDIKLVMNTCDTITVLDHGRKIAEGSPAAVRAHPEVIRAYLGKRGAARA